MTAQEEKIYNKQIRNELKKLDESQIVEIARDIGIKEDSFSLQSVYDDRIKAINRLLDLADRREILDKLTKEIYEKIPGAFKCKKGTLNSPSKNEPSEKHFKYKVAKSFKLLNCTDHKHTFKHVLDTSKAGVFLIQTDNESVQNWLVYLLAESMQTSDCALKCPISIGVDILMDFDNAFYKEFSRILNKNLNHEMLIRELIEYSQTRTVILVFKNITYRKIYEESLSKLYGFCSELVGRFQGIPNGVSYTSRLALLLVTDDTVFKQLRPDESQHNTTTYRILKVLNKMPEITEITDYDVSNWLIEKDVRGCLGKTICQINELIPLETIKYFRVKPHQRIDDICHKVFKIENGISEIEPYWKLI